MGVWKVPEDQVLELGKRMAATRGISHCYERPTYPDWPYALFTMAHGRSKEECDAILDVDRRLDRHPRARHAVLVARSTRRCGCSTSPTPSRDWEREHGA